jgi:hypothetical protein
MNPTSSDNTSVHELQQSLSLKATGLRTQPAIKRLLCCWNTAYAKDHLSVSEAV